MNILGNVLNDTYVLNLWVYIASIFLCENLIIRIPAASIVIHEEDF